MDAPAPKISCKYSFSDVPMMAEAVSLETIFFAGSWVSRILESGQAFSNPKRERREKDML